MVATSQPLATEAGLRILQQGGSAADAAVAAAAALNVTEPCSTGLGGDAFCLYYSASDRSVRCLMGNGRSPAGLTLPAVRAAGVVGPELPPFSAMTVTVPGAAALWEDTVKTWGRLPLSQVLQPAVELASGGFPVSPVTSHHWRAGARQLRSASGAGAGALLGADGEGPLPGEVVVNADLADTLRTLGEKGAKEGFYSGRIADAIVSSVQERGGVLTHADLAEHCTLEQDPISTEYRGFRIYEPPPPTAGLAALIGLNVLESVMGPGGPPPLGSFEALHARVEAMRVAFLQVLDLNGDATVADVAVDVAALLDKGNAAAAARKHIRPDKAAKLPDKALWGAVPAPSVRGGDTVYFCAVDGEGNAASFINSNYMGFGTGIVPKGCGFSLQNRGHNFTLTEGHPNSLAPRKRPYHTIIPAMATHADDGALLAAFGVMGAFMQPQGHLQVISNILDYGLDPQAALDFPRFCIDGVDTARGAATLAGARLLLEQGVDPEAAEQLRAAGHAAAFPVEGHRRAVFGRGQVILRDRLSGVLWGGSDPRADGLALGY